MHRLNSISSDPLSQIHQFNWSTNVASNSLSPPPASINHSGSSALRHSLTQSHNQSLPLSPIGSQFLASRSRQGSVALKSSTNQPQLGGSAQLLNSVQSQGPGASSQSSENSKGLTDEDKAKAIPTVSGGDKDFGTKEAQDWDKFPQIKSNSDPNPLMKFSFNEAQNHQISSMVHANQSSKTAAPLANTKPNPNSQNANSAVSNPPTRSGSSSSQQQLSASTTSLPRSSTTLWMGDLESWMDEDYVRRCVIMMGWHLPHYVPRRSSGQIVPHDLGPNGVNVKIKMVSGASPSSAYCFLTYPDPDMAEQAWRMISNMPPTLMPGCERTFKLNWATGLPGVQPTWDREFSVFIRDLDREVTEGELVSLFTCNFPSTKSAKIMGDLSTGLSRGYAFIRFGEESDMHRALALGRSKNGTGMYLRGRCIKISEASGSSGTAGDHHSHHRSSISGANQSTTNVRSRMHSVPSSSGPEKSEGEPASRPKPSAVDHSHSSSLIRATPGEIPAPARQNSRDSINLPATVLRPSGVPHPRSMSTNSIHVPQVPLSSVNLNRTTSTCTAPFDCNSGIPVRITPSSMGHPLPRQVGTIPPPHSVLPPGHLAFGSSAVAPSTQTRSNLSSHSLPITSSVACPTNSFSQPVFPQPVLFPAYHQVSQPSTLASNYPNPPERISPMTAASVHSPAHFYQQMAPRHESYLNTAPAAPQPNTPVSHFAALAQISAAASYANNDPSNTTVFVGGLPACISEETLKTFFQNFGEITYVKIPPNKGCGFVQYVRRADAEQAMIKMHDFPIHGKSRIRLSWGRSLGDKQVEYVKKLSSALGISFESVWKIVQGQDHSTIKQIALVVSGSGSSGLNSPPNNPLSALPSNSGLVSQKATFVSDKEPASMISYPLSRVRSISDTTPTSALQSLPGPKQPINYEVIESQAPQFMQNDNSRNLQTYGLSLSNKPESFHSSFNPQLASDSLGNMRLAASQSNGSSSACRESLINSSACQSFEIPKSAMEALSISERPFGRRATIHPCTSTALKAERSVRPESPQSTWIADAPFSQYEPVSVGSLESKWASLGLNSGQNMGNSIPLLSRSGSDDLSTRSSLLGRSSRGGFLGGLMEEEEESICEAREFGIHTLGNSGLVAQQGPEDYYSVSPPSLTHSSSQNNSSQRGSHGLGGDKLESSTSWSFSPSDLSNNSFPSSFNTYTNQFGSDVSLKDSEPNEITSPKSWEQTVQHLNNNQPNLNNSQSNTTLFKAPRNSQEPFGFELLEKFWRTSI